MKKTATIITSILIASLSLLSCQNKTADLSDSEKDTVKQEISKVNAVVIKGVNDLNLADALKGYSTDVTGVNTDGSLFDYTSLGDGLKASFGAAATLKFTKVKENFIFLSNTIVLCTWTGTVDLQLKTGEHLKFAPHTASLVYKNINGEWKIIHEHNSETQVKENVKM